MNTTEQREPAKLYPLSETGAQANAQSAINRIHAVCEHNDKVLDTGQGMAQGLMLNANEAAALDTFIKTAIAFEKDHRLVAEIAIDQCAVLNAQVSQYKRRDRNWLVICLVTALAGVAGMGLLASKGYSAGREIGMVEGQSEVISKMGWYSILCVSPRDANDAPVAVSGSDCKTIYNNFEALTKEFGYGEQKSYPKGALILDKLVTGRG